MNDYAFAYDGAPLKSLKAEIVGGQLRISGQLHKAVVLPFVLQGRPKLHLRVRSVCMRTRSVQRTSPVKSILHLFGEDLAKLVNTNEAKGVRIEGDDVLLFPDRLLPAPHIHGKVTHVALENGHIVQTFGSGQPAPAIVAAAKSSELRVSPRW